MRARVIRGTLALLLLEAGVMAGVARWPTAGPLWLAVGALVAVWLLFFAREPSRSATETLPFLIIAFLAAASIFDTRGLETAAAVGAVVLALYAWQLQRGGAFDEEAGHGDIHSDLAGILRPALPLLAGGGLGVGSILLSEHLVVGTLLLFGLGALYVAAFVLLLLLPALTRRGVRLQHELRPQHGFASSARGEPRRGRANRSG